MCLVFRKDLDRGRIGGRQALLVPGAAALADQSLTATRIARVGAASPSWGTAIAQRTIVQPFHVGTGRRLLTEILAVLTPTRTSLVIVGAASVAGRGWRWNGRWNWSRNWSRNWRWNWRWNRCWHGRRNGDGHLGVWGIPRVDGDLGTIHEALGPISGIKYLAPLLRGTNREFRVPEILRQARIGPVVFGVSLR